MFEDFCSKEPSSFVVHFASKVGDRSASIALDAFRSDDDTGIVLVGTFEDVSPAKQRPTFHLGARTFPVNESVDDEPHESCR